MVGQIRKALGALYALLGAYYCAVGVAVLVRLPAVTHQWIERSGDRDFRLDYDLFLAVSGVGAAMILVLGLWTVVKGVATARGRYPSWLWLALLAVPLHFVWWMYRVIGSGSLGLEAIFAERLRSGVQFGLVCAGYLLLWTMNRRSTP